MAENKSLYELGEEYEKTALIVKSRITERLKRLRKLRAENRLLSDEAYTLKSELNYLYKEYNDTREIARHLKNYYDKNSKDISRLFGI